MLLLCGTRIHAAEMSLLLLLLLLLLHLHELLLLGTKPGPAEALVSHEPLLTAVHLVHLAAVAIVSPAASVLLVIEGGVHARVAAVHAARASRPVGELPCLGHHLLLLLEVHHLLVTHWLSHRLSHWLSNRLATWWST